MLTRRRDLLFHSKASISKPGGGSRMRAKGLLLVCIFVVLSTFVSANADVTAQVLENPFVCDGEERPMIRLSGLNANANITFTSPLPVAFGITSAREEANQNGQATLYYSCSSEDHQPTMSWSYAADDTPPGEILGETVVHYSSSSSSSQQATTTQHYVYLLVNGEDNAGRINWDLEPNVEHTVVGSGSADVERVLVYIIGQDVQETGETATIQFTLQPGQYELDIIGFGSSNTILASHKLRITVPASGDESETDEEETDSDTAGSEEDVDEDSDSSETDDELAAEVEDSEEQERFSGEHDGTFVGVCKQALSDKADVTIAKGDLNVKVDFSSKTPPKKLQGTGADIAFHPAGNDFKILTANEWMRQQVQQLVTPQRMKVALAYNPCEKIDEITDELLENEEVEMSTTCAAEELESFREIEDISRERGLGSEYRIYERVVTTIQAIVDCDVERQQQAEELLQLARIYESFSHSPPPRFGLQIYDRIIRDYRTTAPRTARDAQFFKINHHFRHGQCSPIPSLVQEYGNYDVEQDSTQLQQLQEIEQACEHSIPSVLDCRALFIDNVFVGDETTLEHVQSQRENILARLSESGFGSQYNVVGTDHSEQLTCEDVPSCATQSARALIRQCPHASNIFVISEKEFPYLIAFVRPAVHFVPAAGIPGGQN